MVYNMACLLNPVAAYHQSLNANPGLIEDMNLMNGSLQKCFQMYAVIMI